MVRTLLLMLLLGTGADARAVTRASKFGGNSVEPCLICTALVLLGEQLAEVHNNTVAKELEVVCDLFPKGPVREGCDALVTLLGTFSTVANLNFSQHVHQICAFLVNSICNIIVCQYCKCYTRTVAFWCRRPYFNRLVCQRLWTRPNLQELGRVQREMRISS